MEIQKIPAKLFVLSSIDLKDEIEEVSATISCWCVSAFVFVCVCVCMCIWLVGFFSRTVYQNSVHFWMEKSKWMWRFSSTSSSHHYYNIMFGYGGITLGSVWFGVKRQLSRHFCFALLCFMPKWEWMNVWMCVRECESWNRSFVSFNERRRKKSPIRVVAVCRGCVLYSMWLYAFVTHRQICVSDTVHAYVCARCTCSGITEYYVYLYLICDDQCVSYMTYWMRATKPRWCFCVNQKMRKI